MTELAIRTRLDIIKRISSDFGVSVEKSRNIVQDVLDGIVQATIEHGRLEVRRFGTFKITHRAARVARNPRTNEELRIPPRYVLTFEPSDKVAEKVEKHYREKTTAIEKYAFEDGQSSRGLKS